MGIWDPVSNTLKDIFPRPLSWVYSRQSNRKGELHCRFDQVHVVKKLLANARPDIVFHCVSTLLPGPWGALDRAHIQPTVHLLEAVGYSPGKKPRVVILGSAAEYGSGRARSRYSEQSVPRPETLYGISKNIQTTLAMAYARWGVPVLVARLFNLLAPDAPLAFAVPRVIKLLQEIPKGRKKGIVSVGPREAVRDFIPLQDALRALTLLGLRGNPGEIYNVCSGRDVNGGPLRGPGQGGRGESPLGVPGARVPPVPNLLFCGRSGEDSSAHRVDAEIKRPG